MVGPSVQIPLPLPPRTSLSEAAFLVSDSNAAAMEWIRRWPEWPAPGMVLWGPAGSGKTHLAHIWLNACRKAGHGGCLLTTESLCSMPLDRLVAQHRAVAIDEVGLGADSGPGPDPDRDPGADSGTIPGPAEHALLHLYNMLAEVAGHLLLLSRRPPVSWSFGLPDLASRLRALPTAAIADPDDALLRAVLLKLFEDRQVTVSEKVVDYLLPRMERSFESACRLVARLDEAALAGFRPVTTRLARQVLGELAEDAPSSSVDP